MSSFDENLDNYPSLDEVTDFGSRYSREERAALAGHGEDEQYAPSALFADMPVVATGEVAQGTELSLVHLAGNVIRRHPRIAAAALVVLATGGTLAAVKNSDRPIHQNRFGDTEVTTSTTYDRPSNCDLVPVLAEAAEVDPTKAQALTQAQFLCEQEQKLSGNIPGLVPGN